MFHVSFQALGSMIKELLWDDQDPYLFVNQPAN